MEKKVCLFVNSMFKVGGEQRITSLLVNGLIEKGIDVSIIIKCNEKVDNRLYNLSKKANLIFLNYSYDFRLNNIKLFEFLRKINRKTGIFSNNKRLIRHFFCSNKMLKDLKKILKENKFDVIIGVAGDRSFILSYLHKYLNHAKLIFWNHASTLAHFKEKNSRYVHEEKFIKPLFNNFDDVVSLIKYDSDRATA